MVEVVTNITSLTGLSEIASQKLILLLNNLLNDLTGLFAPALEEHIDGADEEDKKNQINKNVLPHAKKINLAMKKYVAGWTSLKAIKWLLNSRLVEISKRWNSGKGPLASELSASEVKGLVRALFANNELRAQVLASINNTPS